jgi:hypothetical protein
VHFRIPGPGHPGRGNCRDGCHHDLSQHPLPAQAAPWLSTAPVAGSVRQVLLITGDRVLVPAGTSSASLPGDPDWRYLPDPHSRAAGAPRRRAGGIESAVAARAARPAVVTRRAHAGSGRTLVMNLPHHRTVAAATVIRASLHMCSYRGLPGTASTESWRSGVRTAAPGPAPWLPGCSLRAIWVRCVLVPARPARRLSQRGAGW